MPPCIILVGPVGSGKRTVAAALSHYPSLLTSKESNPTFNPSDLSPPTHEALSKGVLATCRNVHFDNIYYTADVQVFAIQTKADAALDIILPDDVTCQAIVGVFDGSSPNAQAHATSVSKRIESLVATFSPEVVAIVATHQCADNTVNVAMENWSNKNGAEYVVSDVIGHPTKTSNDRDKEGLARLWELLETVMWQSMKMKPRGGSCSTTTQVETGMGDQPILA